LTKIIYFIVGPTAIGKSKFAINLAKKINGHVINADSMQVYNNLEILSARPNIIETKEITHHLYGHIQGDERYNVSKWCNEASNVIDRCYKENITPILVGGTGLYFDKLVNGLADIPAIPEKFKKESDKLLDQEGKNNFYNIVKNLDLQYVSQINLNDIKRLKRVWEVFMYTGMNLTTWHNSNSNIFLKNKQKYKLILFLPNRSENYDRVNNRFIKMFNEGAINEVRELLSLNLNNTLPIMKAHGVPEISLYLKNIISKNDCIERAQKATRNYVKRQHTWWNGTKMEIFKKINQFPDEIDFNSIKFV
tara:strand:- start:24273 stop:25193 length:921 start_codon:yes stop_codon:yes gene_type:complete